MRNSSGVRFAAFHARVIQGDRAAVEQLIAELHEPLRRKLRQSFPRMDPDDLADIATDAILVYMAQPHRFDDARNVPLGAYVYGIAARILRNRQRSEMRRSTREARYAAHLAQAYQPQANHGASAVAVHQLRCALALVCNARELAAMRAWLNEEHHTVVVNHLGSRGLEPINARREVELFIKRIIKRLERHFRNKRVFERGQAKLTSQTFNG